MFVLINAGSGVKIEACVEPVSLSTKEEESTEHPTVLDTADARRIVRPGMTPNDMILFRKAQKIAAEVLNHIALSLNYEFCSKYILLTSRCSHCYV